MSRNQVFMLQKRWKLNNETLYI